MYQQEIREKIEDVMYWIESNTKYVEESPGHFKIIHPNSDHVYNMLLDITKNIPNDLD